MITIIGIIVSVIVELDCTVNEHRDLGGGGTALHHHFQRELLSLPDAKPGAYMPGQVG